MMILKKLNKLTGVEWKEKDNKITSDDTDYSDVEIEIITYEKSLVLDDLFNEESEFVSWIKKLKEQLQDTTKDYTIIINNHFILSVSELPMKRLKIAKYIMLGEGICYLGVLE